MSPPARTRRSIIAHHLILTLYGHWPPNDPRGSRSEELYDEKFAPLGPIHQGRKPAHMQPTRKELRQFHQQAEALMNFPVFWLDEAKRQATADAFKEVIEREGYTCYACAILSNHAHLVIRIHRDSAQEMLQKLAETSAARLRLRFPNDISKHHPVWSAQRYKIYLDTPDEVRGRITYTEDNPEKEGLPRQHWSFVQPYNNWPFHKQRT